MKKQVDITEIQSIGFERNTLDTEALLRRLNELRNTYQQVREPLERLWDDYYLSYLTTPGASHRVSSGIAKRHIGDVNTQWRHKLKSPKAFETVETIVSWLMGAFFPNEFWFDLKPCIPMYDPSYQQQLDVIKFYLSKNLNRAHLKRKFRLFLRELSIAGTAALAFPLVGESLKLDVMPCYNFWLDPDSQDPNSANMIRLYNVSKVQLRKYIKDEYFNVAEDKDFPEDGRVATNVAYDTIIQQNLKALSGTTGRTPESKNYHDVYEYWGNLICDEGMLINVRATFTKDILLGIEANPFERRPFIIGSYIPLSHSPYGVGALQPIASQLYFKDVLTSRHADNVAVGSDTMLEVVEGQVLDMDKVVVKPGQRIPVTKPGSVVPVTLPVSNLSIQEMGIIDQTIDKATGTGPYIGVNAGRSGERVTAAEIDAQRQAGGNRLTDVYSDIEVSVLLPLLEGYYYYLRKFGDTINSVVRSNDDNYFIVDRSTFNIDLEFSVLGANNVADKEYRTRQLVDFLNLVSSNEQLAQRVNWDTASKALARLFVPDMADELVQEAPPPAAPEMPQGDPLMNELQNAAAFSGGQPAQQALAAAEQTGQLDQLGMQTMNNLGLGQ
jgi:hypothetical protein